MKKSFAEIILLISVIFLVGCSTMQAVDIPQDPSRLSGEIKPGDEVRAITIDRKDQSFKVTGVDSKAIYGHDQKVAYHDLVHLEKKQLDKKTVIVGSGGVITGIAIAAGIIFATCVVLI